MTAGLAMLSTIVFCEDRLAAQIQARLAEVLARTLASLVTAKVEGILADVRIAGPAGAGLEAVANHAGCAFVEAAAEADWLRAALEAAKERLAFLLRCGFAPDPGFIEEAAEFLSLLPKGAPSMLLRAEPEAFLERLAPSLAPAAGLIGARNLLLSLPRGGFHGLVRAAGRTVSFHSRARRIW
jgi:hypothetical protein